MTAQKNLGLSTVDYCVFTNFLENFVFPECKLKTYVPVLKFLRLIKRMEVFLYVPFQTSFPAASVMANSHSFCREGSFISKVM